MLAKLARVEGILPLVALCASVIGWMWLCLPLSTTIISLVYCVLFFVHTTIPWNYPEWLRGANSMTEEFPRKLRLAHRIIVFTLVLVPVLNVSLEIMWQRIPKLVESKTRDAFVNLDPRSRIWKESRLAEKKYEFSHDLRETVAICYLNRGVDVRMVEPQLALKVALGPLPYVEMISITLLFACMFAIGAFVLLEALYKSQMASVRVQRA